MTYRYLDIDAALDFAYLNQRGNKFCAQMVRYFETRGELTPAQISALLRIRSQK